MEYVKFSVIFLCVETWIRYFTLEILALVEVIIRQLQTYHFWKLNTKVTDSSQSRKATMKVQITQPFLKLVKLEVGSRDWPLVCFFSFSVVGYVLIN